MILMLTSNSSPFWRAVRPCVVFSGNLFFVLSIFAAHVPAALTVGFVWGGTAILGEGGAPQKMAQELCQTRNPADAWRAFSAKASPVTRMAAVCGWGLSAVVCGAHALMLLRHLSTPRDVGRAYGRLLALTLILSVFPGLAIYVGIRFCPAQAAPAMRIGYLTAGLLASGVSLAVILKAINLARRASAPTRLS